MSDYTAAAITLGGPMPFRLIGPLCLAIAQDGASLERNAMPFLPVSAEDLLQARCEEGDKKVLKLYSEEVADGRFESLEDFLEEKKLSFRRHSDGTYAWDPEVVEYRPEIGIVRLQASREGEALVSLARFQVAVDAIGEAIKLLRKGHASESQKKLSSTLKALYCDMPREVPPLESFEIVKGGRRVFHT